MRPPPEVPAAAASQLPTLAAAPDSAADESGGDADAGREILARFRRLPGERLALLECAAEVATACGCGLYWVGGGVRDLWLGRSELDVDLVVEGDLAPFAERFAERLGSALLSHPQFLTAELEAPGGVRVDLARARSESYAAPATLPRVEPDSLARDLVRRDFTVNCLALALAPDFGERLIDPCQGLEDLSLGRLRTLHPASFEDDPTRLLRGVEFEARLGFAFAPETWREAERAVAHGAFALLSPARRTDALRRALGRPESASAVLHRLRDVGWLPAIVSEVRTAGAAARFTAPERFDAARRARAEAGPPSGGGGRLEKVGTFSLALLCLGLDLEAAQRQRLVRRLTLSAREQALLALGPERVGAALAALPATGASLRPSAVHRALGGLTGEELAVVAARSPETREWVRREYADLRRVRLAIGGRELMAAGLGAGPALGRALELTLEAKLDGRLGAEGELGFALRTLGEEAAPGTGASDGGALGESSGGDDASEAVS